MNVKPPQAGGLTAATTDAANMTAPEVSPAIEDRATGDEELTYDEVSHGSGDYDAFNMPLESRKPEKGSDEWYEMMDNPKSAWRAGE